MSALVAAMGRALAAARVPGDASRSHRAGHNGFERRTGRRKSQSAGRLLSVVRSPRLARGRRDHRGRAPFWSGSDSLVRRNLFLGVGFLEAAALASDTIRTSGTAWRPRSNIATWWRPFCAAFASADQVPRSICAMGHKWMWNASLGGLPPDEFLTAVDPLLGGVRAKIAGSYATSDAIAGAPQRRVGGEARPAGRHSRCRWARSMRIGMRSARAAERATW